MYILELKHLERWSMKLSHPLLCLILLILPLQIQAGPDGEALYQANCSACHQVNGGGIGLPLSPSKLATFSDDYIKLTIRNGRVGRIMPAFKDLSNAQVDAITRYIRSWSGVAGTEYPVSPVRGDAQRGQKMFDIYCSECHSEDGSGGGLGTGITYSRDRSFAVMPPAITNPGFLASASDQMIKKVIMLGRPGTEMQSFLDKGLVEQDINDLVSYIRSFELRKAETAEPVAQNSERNASLIFDSTYDFDTTVENVKDAITGRNFRYLPDRFLEQGLGDDATINRRQLTIRYCNFNQLSKLIRIEPRLGVGLPCRITVIEDDSGKVQLIAMNLPAVAALFNNNQLTEMSRQFQTIQIEIIEEAIL